MLSVAALAMLASCSGKPTGQVVAKVAGQEVTTADLRLEMAQMGGGNDSTAVQQQALKTLIARKLMVREAEKRNIDTSPEGVAASARAREMALIELLRAKLVSDQPVDSSDTAVNKFIVAHPTQFADRKLITADQLAISSNDPALGPRLQAMGDLGAIEAYLTQNNIAFVRSAAVVDTAQISPDAAAKIGTMQTNAVYALPAANGPLRVLRVISAQDTPLTGNDARNVAIQLMQAGRSQASVATLQDIVKNGRTKVWIDPAFASS
jgi:EpsD family peptidyl-prolyl cis-trans isomerase